MRKNKKQLSIFKRIGLIAIALFSALGSLLLPFASKKQNNFACADDSTVVGYQFNGSDIMFFSSFRNAGTTWSARPCSFDISLIYTISDGWSIDFGAVIYRYDNTTIQEPYPLYPKDPASGEISRFFTRENFNSGYTLSLFGSDLYAYIPVYIKSDVNFSANCKLVSITQTASSSYLGNNITGLTNFSVINIRYYDFDNNSFLIQILCPQQFLYDDRTYYFNDNFSDSDIFNNGYTEGFNAGLAENQQPVYDRGFNAGYNAGEAFGYDKGVLEANDYSFKSLFGAVIDAPIKAFSGFFNFNFLGVNLLDFFFGLITFGIIIFVIKLLIGGK